jgi:hypothetical protein
MTEAALVKKTEARMRVTVESASRVAEVWTITYAVIVWPLYVWDVRTGGVIVWLVAMFILPALMAFQMERGLARLFPHTWFMSYVWAVVQITLLLLTCGYLLFDQPPWLRPQTVPWEGEGRDVIRQVGWLSSLFGPPVALLWIRSALKRLP